MAAMFYWKTAGVVTSFYRGCEGAENTLPDGENASPDLVIYAWKCDTDLCNTGDGTRPPGGAGQGGSGIDGFILVPGSSASGVTSGLFILFLTAALLL